MMFNYPVGSGGKPPAKKPAAKPMAAMVAEPEEGAMGGEESPEQVHEQHGPPMEVHTQHDDAGMHHVHSVHMDGHEHHSDHGSREEAHEHVGKLHDIDAKEHAEPDADDGWDDEPK